MTNFVRERSLSLLTVVLVLLIVVLMQDEISYSTSFGRLEDFMSIAGFRRGTLPAIWLVIRLAAVLTLAVLWLLKRTTALFKGIVVVNSLLTFGLFLSLTALTDVLFRLTQRGVEAVLIDAVLMAITNILIFSIWYWIIDPPGVDEARWDDAPWDFLFPQRNDVLPNYEAWLPRYSDYLYVAFTTSFAFSPTDAMPLTRRAKMLMMTQAIISIITLTGIAGSALGLLAGSASPA